MSAVPRRRWHTKRDGVRATISVVGKVPSQMRACVCGSRTSQTQQEPPAQARTPAGGGGPVMSASRKRCPREPAAAAGAASRNDAEGRGNLV